MSRVTHTRLEKTVDECSKRHCVPRGPILLKNGANFLNLTGTPSSRAEKKKKLEKKEADDKAKRLVEEKKKKALKKEKKDSKKDQG